MHGTDTSSNHGYRHGKRKRRRPLRQQHAEQKGHLPDEDTKAIAATLNRLVAERGLTPWRLAGIARVSPPLVYGYLDPFRYGLRSMNLRVLRQLADGLQVPLRDLIP